jgi:hypothetical protein
MFFYLSIILQHEKSLETAYHNLKLRSRKEVNKIESAVMRQGFFRYFSQNLCSIGNISQDLSDFAKTMSFGSNAFCQSLLTALVLVFRLI